MNKPIKPTGFNPKVAPAQPLTEEEKKMKIMQFLQQKREAFAINLLCSICHNSPGLKNEDLIIKAVDLADGLIEKLYPIPETQKPAE